MLDAAGARELIDGVPVYFLASSPGDRDDGSQATAVPRATFELVARVGVVDERLPATGLTHLAEHLALAAWDDPTVAVNGQVGTLMSTFVASGPAPAVAGFAEWLCRRIDDLPLDRSPAEREVLASEQRGRRYGPVEHLLALRYGPHGPGLLAWGEVGLGGIDEAAVQAWSSTRMARGNVVARWWGPPPPSLSLPLPDGLHRPVPPDRTRAGTDGAFEPDAGTVATSGRVSIGPGLSEAIALLTRQLQDRLRARHGWSYETWASLDRVSATHGHLALVTDVDPERGAVTTNVLLDLLDELLDVPGPSAGLAVPPLAADAERGDSAASDAAWQVARASEVELLTGRVDSSAIASTDPKQPDGSVAAVRERLDEFRQTLLVLAPFAEVHELPRLHRIAPPPPARITGDTWTFVSPSERHLGIIVGDAGVAVTEDGRPTAAIRFDQLAGVMAWADGTRQLVGVDGGSIIVDPQRLELGFAAIHRIDGRVAPQLIIPVDPVGRRPLGDPPLVRSFAPLPADRTTVRTTQERRAQRRARRIAGGGDRRVRRG